MMSKQNKVKVLQWCVHCWNSGSGSSLLFVVV